MLEIVPCKECIHKEVCSIYDNIKKALRRKLEPDLSLEYDLDEYIERTAEVKVDVVVEVKCKHFMRRGKGEE